MGRILNPEFVLSLCCGLVGFGCIITAFILGPWFGFMWALLFVGIIAVFTAGMLSAIF